MSDKPVTRLDELDQEEWWDICCRLKPGMAREKFDEDWRQFISAKVRRSHH